MFKKIKEKIESVDPISFWYPQVYFPVWLVLICIVIVLNMFVVYRFDGKMNETTQAVAVVKEVPSWRTYTLQINGTNDEMEYKTFKSFKEGESIKGYYDGKHFLSEKQAKKRGIFPVLIWMVPLCLLIYAGISWFILAFVKAALRG